MRLARLTLRCFRNLEDQTLEFPAEGVAIVGPNAQGKTNLLESIQYLETFRSFRRAPEEQMVRIGARYFRIEGRVGDRTVTAAYDADSREKRVTLDGKIPDRIGDAIGAVGSVLFTPDDVRLVSDGPAERRRYLDVVLSLNEPGYLASLLRFRQVLQRRNAALRRGEGARSAAAWNEGLVTAGSEVSVGRARWIRERGTSFGRYWREASGSGGAGMSYEASIPGVWASLGDGGAATAAEDRIRAVEAVANSYGAALEASRDHERRLRTTVIGPHRDDLRFLVDAPEGERDARELGSGGERRTIALALRLIEADTVRDRRGGDPILLLDDLFAELDEARSTRVLELLDRVVPGQVVLTAPKESDVRFRSAALPRWNISAGRVGPGGAT